MSRFILAAAILMSSSFAKAGSEREFIMSCTYGVLAGTLVGAASLAFEDNPGDNLQRVARGASLGLYAGITLGVYTVYYLPKKIEERQNRDLDPDLRLEVDEYSYKEPEFQVMPLIAQDGGGLGMIYRF